MPLRTVGSVARDIVGEALILAERQPQRAGRFVNGDGSSPVAAWGRSAGPVGVP